jgi:hypothetical protein
MVCAEHPARNAGVDQNLVSLIALHEDWAGERQPVAQALNSIGHQ